MNREQKAAMVDDLHGRFEASPFVVLADFKGSTVPQMDVVRRRSESAGIYFRVVKNTLAVRALEGTGKEQLGDHFKGNVGVLVSGEDAIATAKLVKDLAKDNDKILVRAGYFDGDVIDAKTVRQVADYATKDELRAQLLSLILQPPQQLLALVQAPARDLLSLLNNSALKLEAAGGDTATPPAEAGTPGA
jgi:large subunit ribosomal protein L10